ncbi:MAG: DUF2911 domain-containing protein [Bdellovibrionota bacterium]
MKNAFAIGTWVLVLAASTLGYAAVDFPGLDKSPADISIFPSKGEKRVAKVIYSRPQINGRHIFGDLVKYGEVWRTGANEATEITFYQDVTIQNTKIPAGTYTLFTIPNKSQWTVILSRATHQWGAYDYKKDQDLVRLTVTPEHVDKTVEALSIVFDESENQEVVNLVLAWENTQINVPISY